MKRFLVVLAIVLAIGATAAVAQPITPTFPRFEVGELYRTGAHWVNARQPPPTPMPMPQQPSSSFDLPSNASTASSDASNIGANGANFSKIGGAIVAIPGGRFITPKMQADRAISKLIRRLD